MRHDQHGNPIGDPVATALPRPRPDRVTLRGRWGFLEPLTPAHAPALFEALSEDDSGFTYLPHGPFDSVAAFAGFVAGAARSDDPLFFAICKPDGAPVGHATFLRITPDHGVIEVGFIHFSARMQRSPLATEAMYLMMAHVFDTLGYRRYEWKCDALNAPSCRAAERLGFTFEGTFRQASTYKGRNRDTAWFSILDTEWPVRKAAFESWLDPANFGPDATQKTRLQTHLQTRP